jgi:hypothetical protein
MVESTICTSCMQTPMCWQPLPAMEVCEGEQPLCENIVLHSINAKEFHAQLQEALSDGALPFKVCASSVCYTICSMFTPYIIKVI